MPDRLEPSIPILLYHSVRDVPVPGMARWTVSPARFDDHVRAIVDRDRTGMTVSELGDALRGMRPLPPRPVVVTFDDGFADTLAAVERLASFSIPATVYVTGVYLGRPSMMRPGDVARLGAASRVEIGAHGMSHRRLDELAPDRVMRELVESRRLLADLTRRDCRTFAYPHGSHDRRSIGLVQSCGYSSAVAVKNALSHPLDDTYALARVTVEGPSGIETVERALDGALPKVRRGERLRTKGYRSVRRLARRTAPWAAAS